MGPKYFISNIKLKWNAKVPKSEFEFEVKVIWGMAGKSHFKECDQGCGQKHFLSSFFLNLNFESHVLWKDKFL